MKHVIGKSISSFKDEADVINHQIDRQFVPGEQRYNRTDHILSKSAVQEDARIYRTTRKIHWGWSRITKKIHRYSFKDEV